MWEGGLKIAQVRAHSRLFAHYSQLFAPHSRLIRSLFAIIRDYSRIQIISYELSYGGFDVGIGCIYRRWQEPGHFLPHECEIA